MNFLFQQVLFVMQLSPHYEIGQADELLFQTMICVDFWRRSSLRQNKYWVFLMGTQKTRLLNTPANPTTSFGQRYLLISVRTSNHIAKSVCNKGQHNFAANRMMSSTWNEFNACHSFGYYHWLSISCSKCHVCGSSKRHFAASSSSDVLNNEIWSTAYHHHIVTWARK